jgi:DNA-binding FadR family transcriptional regulator
VSRGTVREALRTLQEARLIERASSKVMVVRRQTDNDAFRELTHALHRRRVTFDHLHEALRTIEPELARLAAERPTRPTSRSCARTWTRRGTPSRTTSSGAGSTRSST